VEEGDLQDRDKEDLQEQGVRTEEDPQGSIQATPASLATKEDQAIEDRAPQDPRMAGATLATPAIQDSNATQGTLATTPATLLATLDTHPNKEVQVQGLDFLPRASQAAPTDPLRPPLTAPQPLQTPLTTGAQPPVLRLPKDLQQGQIPPRVALRPLPVNMKGHLLQRGRPPYMPRVTRQEQGHSRHRAPLKRRAATTVDRSLGRKEGFGQLRLVRVQVRDQDPPPHQLDPRPQDPCHQPSPSPGREEQSRCLPGRQAGQAKATVRA